MEPAKWADLMTKWLFWTAIFGGTEKNLRVADASVFPFIPGFFIVTPILDD